MGRLGTDYVDITGEPDYVRSLIDKYDDAAKAMGVRVVPCCGYDSVPFDIGCFVAAEKLRHSTGMRAAAVEALIGHSAGGVSGGTIASAARCAHCSCALSVPSEAPKTRELCSCALHVSLDAFSSKSALSLSVSL
jgi:short subunit dehydrogenase-like uncharacterized protein